MTPAELKALIDKGETADVVFYKPTPSARRLARQIVTFGNLGGGLIVVGVDEKKKIINVSNGAIDPALGKARSMIEGDVKFYREGVRIDGKKLAVIHVEPFGKPGPLKLKGVHTGLNWIRSGHTGRSGTRPPGDEQHNGQNAGNDTVRDRQDTYLGDHISDDLSDRNMTPCFGVDSIADSFFKIIRQTSTDHDNICFLGVFGKWGRGKSFFLRRLKERAGNSYEGRSYDFVTFNVWKYQDTPAIWAHLIHTLLRHKSWFPRLVCSLTWRSGIGLGVSLILLAVAVLCGLLAIHDWNNQQKPLLSLLGSAFSLTAAMMSFLKALGPKLSEGNETFNIKGHLGVQFQTERILERILKRWNWGHITNNVCFRKKKGLPKLPARKVVLIIEDLDRCTGENMIAMLDALKLVMENPRLSRRMIVIVAVDPDKLIKAYKNRFTANGTPEEAEFSALEQMNKIFLTGIRLPRISRTDMEHYIDSLADSAAGIAGTSDEELTVTIGEGVPPVEEEDVAENTVPEENAADPEVSGGGENPPYLELDQRQTIDLIKSVLKKRMDYNNYYRFSPRQIKVIFYRMELANNLLCDAGLSVTEGFYESVVDFSIGVRNTSLLNTSPLGRIVEMVVPYRVGSDPADDRGLQSFGSR